MDDDDSHGGGFTPCYAPVPEEIYQPSVFEATRFVFLSMGEWVPEAECGKRGVAMAADITFR